MPTRNVVLTNHQAVIADIEAGRFKTFDSKKSLRAVTNP